VNCHTAVHSVNTPWVAFKPPFEKTNSQIHVFDSAINWIVDNTEYEAVDINYEGESYKASGSAMDWCFKEFGIPSFTFEILSPDYDPAAGGGKHDHLLHWMKTTLPVFMYFLVNIENLYHWDTPDIEPVLPEGIPPIPLGG